MILNSQICLNAGLNLYIKKRSVTDRSGSSGIVITFNENGIYIVIAEYVYGYSYASGSGYSAGTYCSILDPDVDTGRTTAEYEKIGSYCYIVKANANEKFAFSKTHSQSGASAYAKRSVAKVLGNWSTAPTYTSIT